MRMDPMDNTVPVTIHAYSHVTRLLALAGFGRAPFLRGDNNVFHRTGGRGELRGVCVRIE
jgi:hypothetical protein